MSHAATGSTTSSAPMSNAKQGLSPSSGSAAKVTSLTTLCDTLAAHFKLDSNEVLRVAGNSVEVHGGEIPGRTAGGRKFIGLSDCVPQGKNFADMNVEELSTILKNTVNKDEGAVPFLLRFCLGEFHYGQRATRLLPGQRKFKSDNNLAGMAGNLNNLSPLAKKEKSPTATQPSLLNAASTTGDGASKQSDSTTASNEPTGDTSAADVHSSTVAAAFDRLAGEAKFRHLHQVAGWVDLSDKQVWDNYVKDVMNNKLQSGDRLFEAGCGVLAFLTSCQQLAPDLEIGGMDGAKKTIELVQTDLVDPSMSKNFFSGMLPDALSKVKDSTWDVVVCNSVYQYLANEAQAKEATLEMLRIAKRWVIIADICDRKYHDVTQRHRAGLENASSELPEYRTYAKRWWEDTFESLGHLVSIRHVEEPRYIRRTERYVVYIEKGVGHVENPTESTKNTV